MSDQLELFLTPEDDGTFQAFIRLMADPAHNPQLRKDAANERRNTDQRQAVHPDRPGGARNAPAAQLHRLAGKRQGLRPHS